MTTIEIIDIIKQKLADNTYSPSKVAAIAFEIDEKDVTPEQRFAIKQIAYPFVYGRPL